MESNTCIHWSLTFRNLLAQLKRIVLKLGSFKKVLRSSKKHDIMVEIAVAVA